MGWKIKTSDLAAKCIHLAITFSLFSFLTGVYQFQFYLLFVSSLKDIFNVFIEFVTVLFSSYVFGFLAQGIRDLSSLITDKTRTPALEGEVLPNYWTAKGSSSAFLFFYHLSFLLFGLVSAPLVMFMTNLL